MKSYKLSELTQTEVDNLKARPRINFSSIFSTVSCFAVFVRKVFLAFLICLYLVELSNWYLNSEHIGDTENCFESQVQPIVDDVRNRGDAAVIE